MDQYLVTTLPNVLSLTVHNINTAVILSEGRRGGESKVEDPPWRNLRLLFAMLKSPGNNDVIAAFVLLENAVNVEIWN